MENRNISIAKINGYTYEKVMKAKQYLEEIGSNKRNFPFDKLVTMYNEIMGTHDSTSGCRCQSPKYYNGIQNYYNYGKLTLINNGFKESDFDIKEETPQPIAENRINLGTEAISEPSVNDNSLETQNEASDSVSEDKVEDDKVEEKEAVTEEKKKAGRPKKSKE